jgi:hypothetical protein
VEPVVERRRIEQCQLPRITDVASSTARDFSLKRMTSFWKNECRLAVPLQNSFGDVNPELGEDEAPMSQL